MKLELHGACPICPTCLALIASGRALVMTSPAGPPAMIIVCHRHMLPWWLVERDPRLLETSGREACRQAAEALALRHGEQLASQRLPPIIVPRPRDRWWQRCLDGFVEYCDAVSHWFGMDGGTNNAA